MLPAALLNFSIRDGSILPHFLGAADHPWLRVLLDESLRFVGRTRRELDERLREPLPYESPTGKRRLAVHVLGRLFNHREASTVEPRSARAAVFLAAARSDAPRASTVTAVAAELGTTTADLERCLFADLPDERIVVEPKISVSPEELALRANLMLAQGLVFRSSTVRIALEGNARAIVRHAQLRGLLCTVAPNGGDDGAILDVSGPLSLFRQTLLYGRRLGELLPLLSWCRRFRLEATCHVRNGAFALRLASGDPIFPASEPRRYDSRLEERFARDFARLAPDWDVLREPEPVRAGASLVFPDFALRHRQDPSRRWLVEIVGFWTPEYLRRKLAAYRAAQLPNLLLCVDEERNCTGDEFPVEARVLRFRRRVDAEAVLALVAA